MKSLGPTYILSLGRRCVSMLWTASVLEILFDSRRCCSFMLRKSVFPPTLIWYVLSTLTDLSEQSLASVLWTMVAPTTPFTSSPIIGTFAFENLFAHPLVDAMKTGMQLTKPTPASSATSAQNSVAFWLPTGR